MGGSEPYEPLLKEAWRKQTEEGARLLGKAGPSSSRRRKELSLSALLQGYHGGARLERLRRERAKAGRSQSTCKSRENYFGI